MNFIYLILSLSFLYLSSRFLVKQLSLFVHRFGGSKKALVIIWSFIFLPGTIIHELSHFFAAILVGARTGKIEILPRFLDDESHTVALGSVQTQKLGILQGVLVGLAPFYTGLGILAWLGSMMMTSYNTDNFQILALQGYLFFTVANSFFPSPSDLGHAIPAAITTAILLSLLMIAGFRFSITISASLLSYLSTITVSLIFGSIINTLTSLTLITLRKSFS